MCAEPEIQGKAQEPIPCDRPLLADNFEEAFLGMATHFNTELACYDYELCIEILERDMSREEAEEFMSFNVTGAWMGKYTPCFLHRMTLKSFEDHCEDYG